MLSLNSPERPFEARGAVRELWSCRDPEILIEGPAGTGKTRGILEKMHYCAMRYPGFRGLIVRQTRESLTESVLVTFEEKVLPSNSPLIEGPQRNLRQIYRYSNGSVIVVGGLDKPSKVMSTEYDIIGLFEGTECTENGYESLLTRLRNAMMPYNQIIVDCNPGKPRHWLNQRPLTGQMTRLLSRHEDNPTLYMGGRLTPQGDRYINEILGKLTGHRRRRLLEGEWAAAEGLVYDQYDPDIHEIEPFDIPLSWPRWRSIDFGFKNPFVCQWWAKDPETRRIYMYREVYKVRTLTADIAPLIVKLSGQEKYQATLADHDLEDRITLANAGVHTRPAFKAIEIGLEAVQRRLAAQRGPGGLALFKNALWARDSLLSEFKKPCSTAEEFDSYSWPEDKDEKPVKEIPVPVDDHGMDALRYAVAEIDNIVGFRFKISAEPAAYVSKEGKRASTTSKGRIPIRTAG